MRVAQLWRYPVKSAQGEQVAKTSATTLGLDWDRRLAVVDGAVAITTPDHRPLRTDDELSAWLGRPVHVAPPPTEPPQYDYPLDSEDESGPWSTWSGPAGVWHDSTRTRISIMSTASLRDWPARRFRSNIVVDGAGEDDLVGRRITIGSVVLDVTKRIDRCVMVTRPQPGGIDRDLTVLRTVARDHDGFLGVGAVVAVAGRLRVGDELR